MKIKFGKLKDDIKCNFYLGGNERQVENRTLPLIINDKYRVRVEDGFVDRDINLRYFEEYEIIER